jgi:hypothetical protein
MIGKWHMYAFADGGNTTATVIGCDVTVQANGDFSGSCNGYPVNQVSNAGAVTGNFDVSGSCGLTGTINAAGFPTTKIKRGHVTGDYAFAVATRGGSKPSQVRLLNLIKH